MTAEAGAGKSEEATGAGRNVVVIFRWIQEIGHKWRCSIEVGPCLFCAWPVTTMRVEKRDMSSNARLKAVTYMSHKIVGGCNEENYVYIEKIL